ncbi:MAG TPA: MFS transporter [Burkholderiales bacterium]|nr:MFS transporter [Burkholderiales bacterium]
MATRVPHRIGLYLAFVQFFFTLTWTVYVIYLPKLAAQAGIPREAVVWILMADQIIFVAVDYAMGVAADRMAKVLGKLSYVVLAVTLGSCLAFLLLPFVAPAGGAWLFLLFTAAWTVSSSALRAPPLVLVGKYAAQPSVPWLSALSLFGLGLASAVSPYLTIELRDADPRLPFVLSSVALALATLGIRWAERNLAQDAAEAKAAAVEPAPAPWAVWFLIAVLLLGFGFQIHFSLNTASLFLKHAPPSELPYLMPVFWIGFNLLMLPASLAAKRYGGLPVAAAGALLAAVAALGTQYAVTKNELVALQFVAGGGWGCVLMSAFSAAIALGHTGREGRMTGALFSLLALAAVARIVILAAQLNTHSVFVAASAWLPVAAWGIAGLLLLALLPKQKKPMPAPA